MGHMEAEEEHLSRGDRLMDKEIRVALMGDRPTVLMVSKVELKMVIASLSNRVMVATDRKQLGTVTKCLMGSKDLVLMGARHQEEKAMVSKAPTEDKLEVDMVLARDKEAVLLLEVVVMDSKAPMAVDRAVVDMVVARDREEEEEEAAEKQPGPLRLSAVGFLGCGRVSLSSVRKLQRFGRSASLSVPADHRFAVENSPSPLLSSC
uniref:TAF15 RNA polymerase II, TATA box binding protein (TBP)-associated factor, 68kDa n=1 Tax=Nothobranchius furzeri TaxID=105023 RepID=A0A1A8VE81_NOTFU